MIYNFKQLTHPGIQSLTPYVPGKSLTEINESLDIKNIIKVASNENVLGCSPKVLEALNKLNCQDLATYPTSISHPFRKELANYLSVEDNMITLSNGSDLLICLLLICFALNSDKHILSHDYAFISYAIQAQTLGIPYVSSKTINWEVDVNDLLSKCNDKTSLIFLANPNNPTGSLIKHTAIKRIIASIPKTTILVLDEAYFEYAKDYYLLDSIELIKQYPNLIVMRTFSKAYGLAGLRLGYTVSNPQITQLLYNIQLPFSVNIAAIVAAQAAIQDQNFINKTIEMNKAGLKQMQQGLEKLNIKYLPTYANFITINCARDSKKIAQELEKNAILARPLHPNNMNNYLRITIGTKEQNAIILKNLEKIIAQGKL